MFWALTHVACAFLHVLESCFGDGRTAPLVYRSLAFVCEHTMSRNVDYSTSAFRCLPSHKVFPQTGHSSSRKGHATALPETLLRYVILSTFRVVASSPGSRGDEFPEEHAKTEMKSRAATSMLKSKGFRLIRLSRAARITD